MTSQNYYVDFCDLRPSETYFQQKQIVSPSMVRYCYFLLRVTAKRFNFVTVCILYIEGTVTVIHDDRIYSIGNGQTRVTHLLRHVYLQHSSPFFSEPPLIPHVCAVSSRVPLLF